MTGRRGEFEFIRALERRVGRVRPPWRLGIGDDAALLRPRAGTEIAVTTDALVEDVHFRWATTDARSLGHKALAVNLSDTGAMGARPLGFVCALALPADAPRERVDGFVSGLLALARRAECPLVGGDTVRSRHWQATLTVFGEVARDRALLRSAARPGDRILVSGSLGAAALGLHLLESGGAGAAGCAAFVRRARRPDPPWTLGAQLARLGLARAAIDLSDGLAADLGHVLTRSGVGADVALERLPLARGLRKRAEALGLDPVALALGGGEDYELLFTVARDAPDARRLSRRLGIRVTEIGRIRSGRGLRFLLRDRVVAPVVAGFDHFKTAPAKSEE